MAAVERFAAPLAPSSPVASSRKDAGSGTLAPVGDGSSGSPPRLIEKLRFAGFAIGCGSCAITLSVNVDVASDSDTQVEFDQVTFESAVAVENRTSEDPFLTPLSRRIVADERSGASNPITEIAAQIMFCDFLVVTLPLSR